MRSNVVGWVAWLIHFPPSQLTVGAIAECKSKERRLVIATAFDVSDRLGCETNLTLSLVDLTFLFQGARTRSRPATSAWTLHSRGCRRC